MQSTEPDATIRPHAPPLVEISGATALRGDREALTEISLRIAVGEHTAVLGPNGSGKSTLMRLLDGSLYPIHRDDVPCPVRHFGRGGWDVFDLRRRLGVVTAEMHDRLVLGVAVGPVTGLDAVIAATFGAEAVFEHHVVTPEVRRRAAEALERAGATHLARTRLGEMSTGEARRVVLARTLVVRPEALLLDEPTAGLDVVSRGRYLRTLGALAAAGTTLILVTHHPEEILPEIGRVVLLKEGRVAFDGSKREALTAERLSGVYGAPLDVREQGGRYTFELAG